MEKRTEMGRKGPGGPWDDRATETAMLDFFFRYSIFVTFSHLAPVYLPSERGCGHFSCVSTHVGMTRNLERRSAYFIRLGSVL